MDTDKIRMVRYSFVLLLLCSALAGNAQNYFVDGANGSDSYSGTQWNNVATLGAFKTIDKALLAAVTTGGNIYVKQGTYAMAATAYIFTNKSFLLQGGFPTAATGTDVSSYAASNTTIMQFNSGPSAKIAVNNNGAGPYTDTIKGFTVTGMTGGDFFDAKTATEANTSFAFVDMTHTAQSNATTYDLENMAASNTISFNNVMLNGITNSGGVIRLINAAKTAVFNAVTVTNCTTTGANTGQICLVGNSASPIIQFGSDCVFTNNDAGGNNGGLFNVLNNTGAFVLSNITTPLSGNKAGLGGVIFFYQGNTGGITISNVTFSGNSATNNGGVIFYYTTVAATPTITNVKFTNNSAGSLGGAIAGSGTAITATASSFCGNTSLSDGGAIYSNGGPVNLDGCVLNNNTAASLGGAIESSAALTISNSTLSGNSVSSGGSGGGAVQVTAASTFTNTTFIGNSGGNIGGAINANQPITISSCNFTQNHATNSGAIQVSNSSVTLIGSGNVFDGNYCSTTNGGAINASTFASIDNTTFRNNYNNGNASNNNTVGCDLNGTGALSGSFSLTNSSMQRAPLYVYTTGTTTSSNSNGNSAGFTAATVPVGCNAAALVLPVTLASFSAISNGCTANLAWQTATEANSSYYAIEAGTNGSNFAQVGKVASKNSTSGAGYSFGYALSSGTTYFRLKMVDLDGMFSYSGTVAVLGTGACGAGLSVKVSPNPTSNVVNIQGLASGSKISLLNISGQKMTELTANSTNQTISLSGYANGIYIVRVQKADGTVSNVKVVKN